MQKKKQHKVEFEPATSVWWDMFSTSAPIVHNLICRINSKTQKNMFYKDEK